MPISISSQVNIFLYSITGGWLIGFIFDMFRIKRKAVKTGSFFLFFEDLLYWLLVALVMFSVVYYSNDGEIRGFIFLGTILGVVLYVLLFSRIVMNFSTAVIRFIAKCFLTIFAVLSYPIRAFLKLIAIPSKYAVRKTVKTMKVARITSKGIISRILCKFKIFLNARKKI